MDRCNRPEKVAPLRPRERHHDTHVSGDVAQDGFSRIARRPRGRMMDESVPLDRADRLESIFRPPLDMDGY